MCCWLWYVFWPGYFLRTSMFGLKQFERARSMELMLIRVYDFEMLQLTGLQLPHYIMVTVAPFWQSRPAVTDMYGIK